MSFHRFPLATLALITLCVAVFIPSPAQNLPSERSSSQPTLTATLRPNLIWQRSSPPRGQMEGPVLYQLLFSTAGTPGTLAKFDSNPRHLTNSLIMEDSAGIHISGMSVSGSNGVITFANGQTFPASTLTGVLPIANGGTGSATQNFVDLTSNQTVGGGKSFSNTVSVVNLALPPTSGGGAVGVITLGGTPFLQNTGTSNTFIGGAGNFITGQFGGQSNIGVGASALVNLTSGSQNNAIGVNTLFDVSIGSQNTALGSGAGSHTDGTQNTFIGDAADAGNGFFNIVADSTAVGFNAHVEGNNSTAIGANATALFNINNATAIGANALVSISNALVLGGTGANAVNVGIGTSAPGFPLEVSGVVRGDTTVRLGSEFGTSEAPVVVGGYQGLVVRRINSASASPGTSVARTDTMTLQRDGTAAGMQIAVAAATGTFSVACLGLTSTTTVVGFTTSFVNPTATTVQVFNQADLMQFNCSFGNTSGGHITEVNLLRHPTGSTWAGTVTSTFNQ